MTVFGEYIRAQNVQQREKSHMTHQEINKRAQSLEQTRWKKVADSLIYRKDL